MDILKAQLYLVFVGLLLAPADGWSKKLDMNRGLHCPKTELQPTKMLSDSEFQRSLLAIFKGQESKIIDQAFAGIPEESLQIQKHDPGLSHLQRRVRLTNDLANALSKFLLESPQGRKSLGGTCFEKMNLNSKSLNSGDRSCVAELFDELIWRVLRRPADLDYKNSFLQRYFEGEDSRTVGDKTREAIRELLLHPNAQFHIPKFVNTQLGRKLDSFTAANLVAFSLTGSAPDDELYKSASEHKFFSAAAQTENIRRVFESPSSLMHQKKFLFRWLGITDHQNVDELAAKFISVSERGLDSEMSEELERFYLYALSDSNFSFEDLFLSKKVFPFTERLARIFGTPVSQTPVEIALGRTGLLTHPKVLLSNNFQTSPIKRGNFILKRLLCVNVSVPANAQSVASEALGEVDMVKTSTLEKTRVMTAHADCIGCHTQINPLGFVFERFGPLGELRSHEPAISQSMQLVGEIPIDNSAFEISIGGGSHRVKDPSELNRIIAENPETRRCFIENMLLFLDSDNSPPSSKPTKVCQSQLINRALPKNMPLAKLIQKIMEFKLASVEKQVN